MKKIAWSLSGSAFYLRGQAYAAYKADKDYNKKPSVIYGSSGGAVVGLFYAVLGADRMKEVADVVNLADAHKWRAKGKNGKMSLRSLMSVVFGGFPVKQDLTAIIKRFISKNDFQGWKLDDSRTGMFVLCVDVVTGERCFYDLKRAPYSIMIKLLNATCAMQGMCAPVKFNGRNLWDGGQLDHQPIAGLPKSDWMNLRDYELLAFYSRGETPNGSNENRDWDLMPFDVEKAGYMEFLNRMVEIDNYEKSLNDESLIDTRCKQHNITQYKITINRVLRHFYDNDKDRQYSQALEGFKAAERTFKNK